MHEKTIVIADAVRRSTMVQQAILFSVVFQRCRLLLISFSLIFHAVYVENMEKDLAGHRRP